MKFETEINTVKQKYGELEEIRSRLGFTRRKICKELMVDPSAWTRWTQEKSDAPPHVYKTLSLLIEKLQNSQVAAFKQRETRPEFIENEKEIINVSQIEAMTATINKLEAQLQNREILSVGWKLLLIMNFALILFVLIR